MDGEQASAPSASSSMLPAIVAQTQNGSSEKPRKQVQVVGQPPVYHGAGRKEETPLGAGSDAEEEDQPDEEHLGQADDDKARTVGDDEVPDDDLLADLDEDEDTIHLTHLRLTTRSLRKMSLHKFSKTLKILSLRQNEISKISDADIGTLTELRDLDLYDNAMERTYGEALRTCCKLESLDLSFNSIHHISHLSHLANLHTLYLIQNKISKVRPTDFAIPLSSSLRSLELGGNKLRNLGHLTQLEELWVGKNKITRLENLSKLTRLRVLSIQSNRITKIENLESLVDLEELYLSHNGVEKVEGLDSNSKLTTLDIGANRVKVIEGVAHLSKLNEFWANDNQITSIQPLETQLGPSKCPDLNTVYLEGNPVQKQEGSSYRTKVRLALPQISQIDATFIRRI